MSRLRDNLDKVRDRIADACRSAGRSPESVRLIAVTKYADLDVVRELVALGVTDFGESRPQQLAARASAVAGEICWHLIGHLQRNKVKSALTSAGWIHSVDSWRLLERIDSLAADLPQRPKLLLEVNVAGETAKDGFGPDEVRSGWEHVRGLRHVSVAGLMTMAPHTDDGDRIRTVFRSLRALRDEVQSAENVALPELSMGMTSDYELAIAEGATCVRIGSALLEGVPVRAEFSRP